MLLDGLLFCAPWGSGISVIVPVVDAEARILDVEFYSECGWRMDRGRGIHDTDPHCRR